MDQILSTIESPHDLRRLSPAELEQLAGEMREALCNLVSSRTAHFASNLGVIELCLALHATFDFSRDRLVLFCITDDNWGPDGPTSKLDDFIMKASSAAFQSSSSLGLALPWMLNDSQSLGTTQGNSQQSRPMT